MPRVESSILYILTGATLHHRETRKEHPQEYIGHQPHPSAPEHNLIRLGLTGIRRRLLGTLIKALNRPIIPKLHVPICLAMGQGLTLFFQQILQRGPLVEENAQVIAHHMSVLTRGTLDQDCAAVVALLGHAMCGALATWLAGKCDAVCLFVLAAQFILLFALCLGLC